MGISNVIGALLIATPVVLGSEFYNVMPRNALCPNNDRINTGAYEADWAVWVQPSSIYGGHYLNGRGSLEKSDDGSTLNFKGFWATSDNMKTAKIDVTYSSVVSSEEAVTKNAACASPDHPNNKVFYDYVSGTVQLYNAATKSIDTYEVSLNMNSAQIGIHGSAGSDCCTENMYGFASWLSTAGGPNVDLNFDLETLDTCVLQQNAEYVGLNHPGGSQEARFGTQYGIIVNELFRDTCVDNARLPVGYNAIEFTDVKIELDDDRKSQHLYGRVAAYVEVNGVSTHLFDMMIDAWWTASDANTFTFSPDGDIVASLNNDNGGFAHATLTEIVPEGTEPLVVELSGKQSSEPDAPDDVYSYACYDRNDTRNKGAPGCKGWLMYRIASPGQYAGATGCDRCSYPMPVPYNDWNIEVRELCSTSGPQNFPDVPALEHCCNSFNVLPHGVSCTPENTATETAHVLNVLDGGDNIHGRFSEGSGALQRLDSTSVQLTGLWATADYVNTAKVTLTYSDPVHFQDALITQEGCGVSNVFDKTFYSTVAGTVELYSSATGESEVYDIRINPMNSAQIGLYGSAKDGCCANNRQGGSAGVWLTEDGSITADFNFDIECGSGSECAALLQATADGSPLVFDDFNAPKITLDNTEGAVTLGIATADGSPINVLTEGGLVSTACVVDGASGGNAHLSFAPHYLWGGTTLSAAICGRAGNVELQWGANGQCQASIEVSRGCGSTIPTCRTSGDPHTKTLDAKRHHYGDGDYVNIFVSPKFIVRGEHFITRRIKQNAVHGPAGQVSTYQSITFTYVSDEGTTLVSLAKPDCECTEDSLYKGDTILVRNLHNCDECAQVLKFDGPTENILRYRIVPDPGSEFNTYHHIYFKDGTHATLLKRASPGNNYVIDAYLYPNTRHRQFETTSERGVCGNWDGDIDNDHNSATVFNTQAYPGFWQAGANFLEPIADPANAATGSASAFPVVCGAEGTGLPTGFNAPPQVPMGLAPQDGEDGGATQLTAETRRRRNVINLDTLANCDRIIPAVRNMGCPAEDVTAAVENCKVDVETACAAGDSSDCVRSSFVSLMTSCTDPATIGGRRRNNKKRVCIFPQGESDGNGGCTCAEGFKGRRCQYRVGASPSIPDGIQFYTLPASSAAGEPACTNPNVAESAHMSVMVHELPVVSNSIPEIYLRVKQVYYLMTCDDCCEDGEDCSGEYTVAVKASELPTTRAKWNGKNKQFKNKVGMRVFARWQRTKKNGTVKDVNRRLGIFKMPVCA
ncbi:hypothetical protein SARC_05734 [Sphaeroforma arctica JP610]|uniref:EGF-like domain-containing protein n=1 Tax=Sphaeroforma arctica JP610 TaxID=667725 RepID=A0A0L0FYR1_9EUKA|nr:hypothetical protein SARC_05734 [Sphaeroforma arctica JP610]KNC81970.1 hypothetical protein SARC_05734 [Sphaeroforma arctica JP610]|eukprot:XP_014155872.1 hypothetical protein SARC_05734 [Sphaeroforma arctica JP610]